MPKKKPIPSSWSIRFLWIMLFLGISCFMGCQSRINPTISFALLTDLHVTPGSENERFLKEVIADINQLAPDLVFVTGDITNTGSDEELINVKNLLDQLTTPYFIIPGNHESNWSESAGHTFKKLWGDDRFVFEKGPYVFIGFNTGPFMRMGDGHVKSQDIRWIERELSIRMKPGKHLFSFTHYPLTEGLDQWFAITPILKANQCRLAFCGHGHQLRLMNFDGIPAIMARSLVYRGENQPGYTLIQIKDEQVSVMEKIPGQPLDEPVFAFDLINPLLFDSLSFPARPGFEINDQYPQIQPFFRYQDTSSVFTSTLVIGDSLLIYGNSAGYLRALEIPEGLVRWETRIGSTLFSSPVLAGDIVVAGSDRGFIYGVSLAHGIIRWMVQTQGPVLTTPLIEKDYVYMAAGSDAFFKLNAHNGDILWRFDSLQGLTQSRASISGNHLVFTAWDTHVYCLDKETGQLLWKWNNKRPVSLLSPGNVVPLISHNKVFVVAPDRYITALDLHSGQEVWRTNQHQVRESQGMSPDGSLVFVKLMNDTLIAVETESPDFKIRWIADAGFGYDHNPCPIVANHTSVIAATRNGLLMALDPHTGSLRWKHKINHTAINGITLSAQGQIWISTTSGQIVGIADPIDQP